MAANSARPLPGDGVGGRPRLRRAADGAGLINTASEPGLMSAIQVCALGSPIGQPWLGSMGTVVRLEHCPPAAQIKEVARVAACQARADIGDQMRALSGAIR